MAKHVQVLDAPSPRSKAETFPLFLHRNGSWCKKIRGKHRYFGKEKAAALEKYHREIGQLSLGH